MESQAGKFCFLLLFVLVCACLSSCTLLRVPNYESIEKSSDSRQETWHHSIGKRPTVLLNRLMYALQNVIGPANKGVLSTKSQMELERREYPKHYWKCYFNAVSCFRRKRQDTVNHSNI